MRFINAFLQVITIPYLLFYFFGGFIGILYLGVECHPAWILLAIPYGFLWFMQLRWLEQFHIWIQDENEKTSHD